MSAIFNMDTEREINNLKGEIELMSKQIKDLKGQIETLKERPAEIKDPVQFIDQLRVRKIYDKDWNEMASLEYVGIAQPTFSSPSASTTWEDWDLSSYVSDDAKYAEIIIRNTEDYPNQGGVRKNGTSLNRQFVLPNNSVFSVTVELDSDMKVERFSTDLTYIDFSIIGYWKQRS